MYIITKQDLGEGLLEQPLLNSRFARSQPKIPLPNRTSAPSSAGRPRVLVPCWVIAHRKNELKRVQQALAEGANALECDLRWDKDRFVVRHDKFITDQPCDFITWLRGVHELGKKHPQLSLVIFDYKEPNRIVLA